MLSKLRSLFSGLLLVLAGLPCNGSEPDYIAIIIDDLGHNLKRGHRAIELPGPLTYAVLPYARFAGAIANQAYAARKEVIVHLPMANLTDHPLGPGGLTASLTRADFLRRLEDAIAKVPHARGLNNHTGSYLTQQPTQMGWLMDDIKQRNFFFIDSRTTHKTVAQRVAREHNILASSRDIFLDNEQSFDAIDRAFKKLVGTAKRRGTAIAIGHPHRVTLDYLERVIPGLADQGVRLVPASNLVALQQMHRLAKKSEPVGDIAATD